jgi:glycosyltransferase involved in cell wall biosynthesis
MRPWIRVLRHRMTRPRRAVALAALSGPLAAVLLLLLGVATGLERLAAVIVLAYLLLVTVAGLVIVIRWRRHRARALDGYAFDGAIAGPASAALTTASAVSSLALDRLRIAAALRGLPLTALVAFGTATRTSLARDALAARVTSFRVDADALVVALAADAPTDELRRSLGPLDLPALVAFLRVLAGVADDPVSRLALRKGALLAANHPDTPALRPDDRRVLVERLLLADEPAAAARLLEAVGSLAAAEWLLRLDTLHPDRAEFASGAEVLWLTAFNSLYQRAGLEQVRLLSDGPTRFDRLTAPATEATFDDGPLISVIMTSHRPGAELETAVRSIIAQSWTRWELIIADDASGEAFEPLLESLAGLDERIRVLRAPENRGTYVRRNDALAAAVGEFATMHDSDDWAHPRRLELQARHLVARPALLANLSRSIRATDALRVAQPRGTVLRLTETSLLFRRERVIEQIGWFDDVRKAADTGFRLRIEAVNGAAVPVIDIEAPLSIVRFSADSLSGAELGDGWMHPARIAYSSAHAHWLARERAAGRPPRLPHPAGTRAFPAPPALLGLSEVVHSLDVLVVVDLRVDEEVAARDRRIDAALSEWCKLGLRVGIMRSDAIARHPLPHSARPSVQGLINDGDVIEVMHGDRVNARFAAVLGPDCLVGLPPSTEPIGPSVLALVQVEERGAASRARHQAPLHAEIHRCAARLAPDAEVRTLTVSATTVVLRAIRDDGVSPSLTS